MPASPAYITVALEDLDPTGFWPRPLVLVVRFGEGGQVALSSTLHKLLGATRLPPAQVDPGVGILTTEYETLTGPWPPDPPLPELYREVRRAVLHVLYPVSLAKRLQEQGRLSKEHSRRIPTGGVPHEREVAACWGTVWGEIRPRLDRESLLLAAQLGGHLDVYNALAGNPACRELVAAMPMLGALLDPAHPVMPLPGTRARETVAELVRQAALREAASDMPTPPVRSGFLGWLECAPVRSGSVPRVNQLRPLRQTVLSMARAGDAVSRKHVTRIRTNEEWYALHAAAQCIGTPGIRAVLEDPAAALEALDAGEPAAKQSDFVRRWYHLQHCLDIGAAMTTRPRQFECLTSMRALVRTAAEIRRSHGQ
jgi:hypothetical protein